MVFPFDEFEIILVRTRGVGKIGKTTGRHYMYVDELSHPAKLEVAEENFIIPLCPHMTVRIERMVKDVAPPSRPDRRRTRRKLSCSYYCS